MRSTPGRFGFEVRALFSRPAIFATRPNACRLYRFSGFDRRGRVVTKIPIEIDRTDDLPRPMNDRGKSLKRQGGYRGTTSATTIGPDDIRREASVADGDLPGSFGHIRGGPGCPAGIRGGTENQPVLQG
jgi:hypothetical protein